MEEGYSAEGTPFLYQDDYRDPATELYHMQARWYDPQAALFTSPDPATGDATDPMLRYPYAYCAGDPLYNSDPSGMTFEDLARAWRDPVLGPLVRKNRALALAFLMKKPARTGGGGKGQDHTNRIRASANAEKALLETSQRLAQQGEIYEGETVCDVHWDAPTLPILLRHLNYLYSKDILDEEEAKLILAERSRLRHLRKRGLPH